MIQFLSPGTFWVRASSRSFELPFWQMQPARESLQKDNSNFCRRVEKDRFAATMLPTGLGSSAIAEAICESMTCVEFQRGHARSRMGHEITKKVC